MNSLERVRQALNCRKPDQVPKALGFFPQEINQACLADIDSCFDQDVSFVEFNAPDCLNHFNDYLENLPKDLHIGTLAQLKTYHEWNYHPEIPGKYGLEKACSLSDLMETILPDLSSPKRYSHLFDQVALLHSQGMAVAGAPPHLGGDLFETAWRLRGFQTFLLDMVKQKKLAHYLLDQLTAMLIHSTVILAQAGVDILLLDDDVAMPTQLMISPSLWREFFKPRMAEVIQTAKQVSPEILIFYHCDGNFTRLIPDLIEIGVNVINPVQPDCMDALLIKFHFGKNLAFWGTVGTAQMWDHGSSDQIRKEVIHRIKTLGPEGLLLSPAYDIDFTPVENIIAFLETAEQFG